jgi:RNA polymerase sigma-70 factor (ECF subfamily)
MPGRPWLRSRPAETLRRGQVQRFTPVDHLTAMVSTDEATVQIDRVRDSGQTYDLRFAEVRSYLVAVCRSLVGDDAEDVVQDTYLIGRSRLGQLRDPDALNSWLAAIAVNECYGRHRRRQRLATLLATLRPTQREPSDLDLRVVVQALPFRERTVVVLHFGHGLSLEEIAGLLAEKPSTIRSVLFRVKKRLRTELGEHPSGAERGDTR